MNDQQRGGHALLNGRSAPLPPAAVPTLDSIATDPTIAASLPPDAIRALIARCAAVHATLLLAALAPASTPTAPDVPQADRLLTPEEAAGALGVTVTWLRRRSARLPFTRRLSRKALRFSEVGLRRWLAARRA